MILAYADDSVRSQLVTCGVAAYDAEQINEAEAALVAMKHAAGVRLDTPLHCRVIFSGEARRHSAWSGVTAERISELVEELCRRLIPMSERALVALIDPRQVPVVPARAGAPEIRLNEKGVASMAYQMAEAALAARYGPDGFRLVIDQDKTRIPWGSQKHQAELTRGLYVDVGPGLEPVQLVPDIGATPKPVLIEVADLYAYAALQAEGGRGGRQGRWFRQLYQLIDPQVLRPALNPHPQWARARPSPGT